MNVEKSVKSSQEQAVAAWVNYLNQTRLDTLMEQLKKEETNLTSAIGTIDEYIGRIKDEIIDNGNGLGGETGMHGFIAEAAQTGYENTWRQIDGKAPNVVWIMDNGPADIQRGDIDIQMKFVNGGNHLSIQAIKNHLEKYPDFLEKGGKYQIPEDHYKKIEWLRSISKEDAQKMPTSTGEFSLKQWKEVNEFIDNGDVPFDRIEASHFRYDEVQKNTYKDSLDAEKVPLKERHEQRRHDAYLNSQPSIKEGAKVVSAAAAVEGGMSLCISIARKKKEGKKLAEFDESDWKDIALDTGKGVAKGGVRGASIYILTNFTSTSAAVASSIVTASFGVAEQAYKLRNGQINETAFIEESEMLCMDAAVSALSSLAGQVLIPVPVLGTVIGNAVGTMLYQIAKDNLSEREQILVAEYLDEIWKYNKELEDEYRLFIEGLARDLVVFMNILDRAFSVDVRIAFEGSIELAREMGVDDKEILDTREKVVTYFVD